MSPLIESLRATLEERRTFAETLRRRTERYAERPWSPANETRYRLALQAENEAWKREQEARSALIRAQISMVLPTNFC